MRILRVPLLVAGAVLLALCLAGCIQVDTTVNVNPDGSGTVDQTLVMKTDMISMMQSFGSAAQNGAAPQNGSSDGSAGGASAPNGGAQPFSLYDPNQLKQDAQKMGPGVTLKSSEPVQNNFGSGYHVIYAFTNIGTLTIAQNPTSFLPSDLTSGMQGSPMGAPGAEPAGANGPDNLHFVFTKGSPAVLQIQFPPQPPKPAGNAGTGSNQPANVSSDELAMVQQFYQDMRFRVNLVFNGTIVDTNATYRNGNQITILDLNFNDLLANPAFMKSLQSGGPPQDIKQFAAQYPSVKFETKPNVTVKFK